MTAYTTVDLSPRIGTEVRISKDALLDGSVGADLKALLVARGVLIFRGLDLSDEDQVRFAATIGKVRLEHGLESTKIVADKDASPIFAEYTEGTYFFHIDGTYTDTPGFATTLRAKKVAPKGGQTQFCNTYALYEDLTREEQAFLDGLYAVHSGEQVMRMAFPNPTEEQLNHWGERRNPPRTHPLVWQHESGRRSLVLACSIKYFEGLERGESDRILDRLLKKAEEPQYIYSHDWQAGDLLVWDNTGTMHRVVPFDLGSGRELNRVTLFGEEKITAVEPALARA